MDFVIWLGMNRTRSFFNGPEFTGTSKNSGWISLRISVRVTVGLGASILP